MDQPRLAQAATADLEEVLGYLNFSAGTADPRFRQRINGLYRQIDAQSAPNQPPPWVVLRDLLRERLAQLHTTSEPFRQVEQAQAVLTLVFDQLLPDYRRYHRDLLFHRNDAGLFRPFFLARACEAVLQQGPPWDETNRILPGAIDALNDFIGYRPVAVLETQEKIEPYPHEWVCPVPVYFRDAGVAVGKYHDLITQALAILNDLDRDLLELAYFSPELLDEVAVDPRAYDFDHPINQRPIHHFGGWDPHQIDNQGRYRRFVLHGMTLEAIWQRAVESSELPADERLFEAGAVLASTMLMASALYGRGPGTHDSTVTLAKLLPRIAGCRDAFYERLLAKVPDAHGERLRAEAARTRQPFGGARQHLNQRIARLRATQLQHVHLAQLFARMGYPEASSRQAQVVPVASARMLCEISGRLTAGHHALDRGQLESAATRLPEIEDLLHRGIECGALVDPWNMLGFQGQFSLFPAIENTVRDHRVDVLVHLARQVFGLYARLEAEAAARGEKQLADTLQTGLNRLAKWWDQFASVEVSGLERLSGREAAESSEQVATVLTAWHEAGEAAGDLAFWRRHVDQFTSPKSYALVVEALLRQRDFVASSALLVQWLGLCEQVPLADGTYSFHDLAVRWLKKLYEPVGSGQEAVGSKQAEASLPKSSTASSQLPPAAPPLPPADCLPPTARWSLARKCFDFLEANAEEYWEVPRLLGDVAPPAEEPLAAGDEEDDEEAGGRFDAAYEEMTYRDSTADGHEGETLEGGHVPGDFELDEENRRLSRRLTFLVTLARLWKNAATRTLDPPGAPPTMLEHRDEALLAWFAQARSNLRGLMDLLAAVERYKLPEPKGTHESLVEYDRRLHVKESLLGRIIAACVETADAARLILASVSQESVAVAEAQQELPEWEREACRALRAMLRGDSAGLRELFPRLQKQLEGQPVLYIPLSRNGDPRGIVAAQQMHQLLKTFLRGLPRLGLLAEACQLIVSAQAMEKHRPEGEGTVTEFDRLFEVGYLAIVESLVDAASAEARASGRPAAIDGELIESLQQLTESLLKRWVEHSRSLRVSVLEKIADDDRWKALVTFIERYGHDMLTQRFLNIGNLRAILHQTVDVYLRSLEAEDDAEVADWLLLKDLDKAISRREAVDSLSLTLEAIVENYGEYKDFNNTTTQSDRGELLWTLLDFLRLKASYVRFGWGIRPVVMAHDVLVRRRKMGAAELWRRAVAERTSDVADWHLTKFAELSREHGMRLPTIADLLEERFIRPLDVDRIRALVKPAIDEVRSGERLMSFPLLEQEIDTFAERPTGSGLDVPEWLDALEDEVDRAETGLGRCDAVGEDQPPLVKVPLSWEDVQHQLRTWDQA